MKIESFICVVLMLTVSPITTVISLDLILGNTPTIQTVLIMAGFGLITFPLWITYIPALVLTPFAMKKLAGRNYFYNAPAWIFVSLSFVAGALLGAIVLSPMMDGTNFLSWTIAGAISGSITFTLIAAVYRSGKKRSEHQNRD